MEAPPPPDPSHPPDDTAQSRWGIFQIRQTRAARWRSALLLLGLIAALFLLASRDPRTYGTGTLCPTLRFLGIYCPGCGSTRAMHDLLHGGLGSAWANNPLLVIVGIPLLVGIIISLASASVRSELLRVRAPAWIGLAIALALIVYCVLRNIPLPAFDALRPPPLAVAGHADPR